MAIDKNDVFEALLALDAYNRHSDPEKRNLTIDDDRALSEKIGLATWQTSSDALEKEKIEGLIGSETAGFSASSYLVGNQKIISYRGTDFNTDTEEDFVELFSDIRLGWLRSFGFVNADDFYAGLRLTVRGTCRAGSSNSLSVEWVGPKSRRICACKNY